MDGMDLRVVVPIPNSDGTGIFTGVLEPVLMVLQLILIVQALQWKSSASGTGGTDSIC